jgi:SulP family sulfate permease
MGELPSTLPMFLLPNVPLTLETLWIILPYAAPLAAVGLLESLMTASIVDELTDSASNKSRECVGQGLANMVTGLLGGMAGCAMIGQSVINVKSGARGRLSTFVAGTCLLFFIVALGDWVRRIPMAALVAVMIMVSVGTFSWISFRNLRTHPASSSAVMLAAVVLVTHDLAKGVLVGVLLSGIFFAWKVTRFFRVTSTLSEDGRERTYIVHGQVFFASAEAFATSFDLRESVERVRIDVTHAHFWDISGVASLDKVVLKLRRGGIDVDIVGMNEASATMVDKHAIHDKPDVLDHLAVH